jgi:hypothetical protein
LVERNNVGSDTTTKPNVVVTTGICATMGLDTFSNGGGTDGGAVAELVLVYMLLLVLKTVSGGADVRLLGSATGPLGNGRVRLSCPMDNTDGGNDVGDVNVTGVELQHVLLTSPPFLLIDNESAAVIDGGGRFSMDLRVAFFIWSDGVGFLSVVLALLPLD